jgi:hypothetical protein
MGMKMRNRQEIGPSELKYFHGYHSLQKRLFKHVVQCSSRRNLRSEIQQRSKRETERIQENHIIETKRRELKKKINFFSSFNSENRFSYQILKTIKNRFFLSRKKEKKNKK